MVDTPQAWKLTKGQDGWAVIALSGDWTSPNAFPSGILEEKYAGVRVEDVGIREWNTALAVFLFNLSKECDRQSITLEMQGIPQGAVKLVALSKAAPPKDLHKSYEVPHFFELLGEKTKDSYDSCVVGIGFVGELLLSFYHLLRGRARMRWIDVWNEIIKAGPKALFIVCLIGFLMGLILAFIGSIPLKWFREEVYVASLIGIGMLRLLEDQDIRLHWVCAAKEHFPVITENEPVEMLLPAPEERFPQVFGPRLMTCLTPWEELFRRETEEA